MLINLEDEKSYFCQALDLFYETQWLHRYPVTEILVRNCLDHFPDGWTRALKDLDNEELNDLVANKITKISIGVCQNGIASIRFSICKADVTFICKRDLPELLLSFVEKCLHLDQLPKNVIGHDVEILPESFRKGLSKKKQHEILHLANLVKSQCAERGITTIVDIGAGLGYVCQLLNFLFQYRVLGLESNPKNVETAKRRQLLFYPTSIDRVNYICTRIDIDSELEIRHFLKLINNDTEEEFCLIGLHACADLGVDACKLFSKISSAKILILQSCCYHKMEIVVDKNGKGERFRNFPVSKTLVNIVESSNRDYYELLKRPFLRLACQEPAVRWLRMPIDSHRAHAFHVLGRAILESYAHKNSISLQKRARKATRKSQCTDFQTYLKDSFLRYEFKYENEESSKNPMQMAEELLTAWNDNIERLEDTEIYTGLQLMLQSPAESLVLQDRCCWLVEMGFETDIVAVTSRSLSPRSHAIVSRK